MKPTTHLIYGYKIPCDLKNLKTGEVIDYFEEPLEAYVYGEESAKDFCLISDYSCEYSVFGIALGSMGNTDDDLKIIDHESILKRKTEVFDKFVLLFHEYIDFKVEPYEVSLFLFNEYN